MTRSPSRRRWSVLPRSAPRTPCRCSSPSSRSRPSRRLAGFCRAAPAVHARPAWLPARQSRRAGRTGPRTRRHAPLLADILDDLRSGRAQVVSDLFGTTAATSSCRRGTGSTTSLLPALPGLGFGALSTFGPPSATAPGLPASTAISTHRLARRAASAGHTTGSCSDLVSLIATATGSGRPIGLLTHHLVHDEAAWASCEAACRTWVAHGAVRFASAHDLLLEPEP